MVIGEKYPYKAFMLTPSCNLREVTVAKKGYYNGYVELATGTSVPALQLFLTKKGAIAFGKKAIERRRGRLAKSVANIERHARNLAKAEAANG